jgi:hypothetical protein
MVTRVAKRPLYFAVVFSYFFVRILWGGYYVEPLGQRTTKFRGYDHDGQEEFDVHLTRIRRGLFEGGESFDVSQICG